MMNDATGTVGTAVTTGMQAVVFNGTKMMGYRQC
jgi:hypothetical protein